MLTQPRRLFGLALGLAMVVLCGLIGLLSIAQVVAAPLGIGTWGWGLAATASIFLGLTILFQVYCCFSLAYAITEGKLLIRWGPRTIVIPAQQVTRTVMAGDLGFPHPVRRWWWPGHYRADTRIVGLGETHYYTTTLDDRKLLMVITPFESFAIAPPDPASFQAALDAERAKGIAAEGEVRYWPVARLPIWGDYTLQILTLICAALTAVCLAIILLRYPGLAESLAIKFNAIGQPAVIAEKSELFKLVLGALGANVVAISVALLVHWRDRVAAYISILGGIGVQILFIVAASRIVA
jgi:hypothetical protein